MPGYILTCHTRNLSMGSLKPSVGLLLFCCHLSSDFSGVVQRVAFCCCCCCGIALLLIILVGICWWHDITLLYYDGGDCTVLYDCTLHSFTLLNRYVLTLCIRTLHYCIDDCYCYLLICDSFCCILTRYCSLLQHYRWVLRVTTTFLMTVRYVAVLPGYGVRCCYCVVDYRLLFLLFCYWYWWLKAVVIVCGDGGRAVIVVVPRYRSPTFTRCNSLPCVLLWLWQNPEIDDVL